MTSTRCPGCGRPCATEIELAEYDYSVQCGLPGVRLTGGVTSTKCPRCREEWFAVRKEGQLLQVLAVALLASPRALSGAELRFLRKSCGLSQSQLAERLRKRRETVAERECRDDPRLTEAEETWFRLVILNEFTAALERDGYNLLSESHREFLSKFSSEFFRRALALASRTRDASRLGVRQVGDSWQLPEEAA